MSEQPALDWREWDPAAKFRLIDRLEQRIFTIKAQRWKPYPWQTPPRVIGVHETWLQLGGRGTGKTDGCSRYVIDHLNGEPCDPRLKGGHRIAIVAPTLGDAVEACVNGPSGLKSHDQRTLLRGGTGGTYVRFHGGAEGKLFGASTPQDVERLRAGGNRCLVWLEEVAAQRHLAQVMQHTRLGLRIGPTPHYIASTTPKPRAEIRALITDARTLVTKGKTSEAHHLDAQVRAVLEEMYAGTRLGRQELDAELLTDVEGALWQLWLIEQSRIKIVDRPELRRVVVAVDPNAGGPAECGIVAVGVGRDKMPDKLGRVVEHAYVLADRSARYRHPGEWAAAAIKLYQELGADAVVAETNNGGDMVGHVIHVEDPTVRYRAVTATRGKTIRAEPVVGLYEQLRVHHVGTFPKLEDQQTTWTDEPGSESPDRMDALVWGLTDLLLGKRKGGHVSSA
jgi:phage terminase large subunit-like protein